MAPPQEMLQGLVPPAQGLLTPWSCPTRVRVWKGFRAPGTGLAPPRGLNDPVPFSRAGLARELLISSSGRRHSRPWGDKGASLLSFRHLPCPDKARHLLVLGGQDKFRCGRFRPSGDPFAAVALRRERAAWLVCPLFSGH